MSLLPAHVDGHLRDCINISMLTGCEYLPMMFYGGHLHGAWKHNTLMREYRSKRSNTRERRKLYNQLHKVFSSLTVGELKIKGVVHAACKG